LEGKASDDDLPGGSERALLTCCGPQVTAARGAVCLGKVRMRGSASKRTDR
jgi:hypothetical protein